MSSTGEQAAAAEVAAAIRQFDEEFPRTFEKGPFSCRRSAAPEGYPLVILPGAGGTSEFFSFVAAKLRDRGFDPILVDYSGTVPPDELAKGLDWLAQALRLVDPVAVGCSYSAYWCQHLPADGAFSGLVLCNGFVEAENLLPNPMFDHAAILTATPESLQAEWQSRARAQSETRLGQMLIHAMFGGLAAKDLRGRLLEVTSSEPVRSEWAGPVALIDCDDDQLVREQARRNFRAAWPDADYLTLKGGGHYPYVLVPDDFVTGIVNTHHAGKAFA
ncbi:MAG: alpha/beta fold hydrolase [Tropicimonas sp.]|uniref:alpha/beta fold hydrolase n=1 Tax=Tropicimonas sp. TaxID=2067044 RepID=UPI003A87EAF7